MTTNSLELVAVVLWPFLLAAAVWLIVVRALAEPDEVSRVVQSLTGSLGATAPPSARPNDGHATRQAPAAKRKDEPARQHGAPRRRLASLGMLLVLISLTSAAASPANAGRFEFDQKRTEVRFSYVMAMATQRGRFTKVSGTLDYDETAPEKSKIDATITAASLTTGEAIVDAELKGPEFFNVVASPAIAFRSTAVRPRSATTADVAGEITLNGITKPVTLKVRLKPHDNPALKYDAGAKEFVATTRIQRSQFNMTKYKALVDDQVELEIAAIVRPKVAAAAPQPPPAASAPAKAAPSKAAPPQPAPVQAAPAPPAPQATPKLVPKASPQ